MSKVQMLRALVKQRLTAAAEEIFGLFERTIAEYEEELCRSKEENHRQRHLLDSVFSSDDVHQLLAGKEEFPPKQQQWSSGLEQKDPEPQKPIKQEKEEHWIGQEGEPLQDPEEDDIIKFTLTRIPVKSEDYEDGRQSSQLHPRQSEESREAEPRASSSTERMQTEPEGAPEPGTHSNPDAYLEPLTEVKTLDSSDDETEHSDDCKEAGELLSGFKAAEKNVINVGDQRRSVREKLLSGSDGSQAFSFSGDRSARVTLQNDQNLFSCSVCNKTFRYKSSLKDHMRRHTGEKPFRCSECGKRFSVKTNLMRHMRLHTGEKPFKCSGCGERFTHSASLTYHMRRHTGEKPFSCPICNRGFMQKGDVTKHMRVHSVKP